jgi:hypothetical protein
MNCMTAAKVVMANHPNLQYHLSSALAWEFTQGPVNLRNVRSLVSTPRLMSFCVRAFSHPSLTPVGDSYLDARTRLADYPQKTWAISICEFDQLVGAMEFVEEYDLRDASVMKLQIWPYPPQSLDDFAMVIAVALSYMPNELMAESRISLAIDELVSEWGFYTDEF